MKLAVDYGILNGDVGEQIEYYRSLGISRVNLGAWSLPEVAEAGYLTPMILEPIKSALDDAGIEIVAFWSNDNSIGAMMDPATGGEVMDRFLLSAETIAAAGIRLAPVMNAIPVPAERRREALWGRMVDTYGALVERIGELGVTIASHTHWTPDHLVWNTETLIRLLSDVSSPRNKALFCAGSLWSAGDVMKDSVERLGHRIGIVHLRESTTLSGECEEIPLGSGKVEFGDVLAALDRSGYEGVVLPEHLGAIAGERDRTATMAMAVGFMRGIMHGLGLREA